MIDTCVHRDTPDTTKGVNRMSSAAQPQGEVKKWRIIVFVIVGGLLALLAVYAGARDLLLLDGQPGFPSEVHRWPVRATLIVVGAAW